MGATAGSMRGEWKAPATFRRIARTLCPLAIVSARSIAFRLPLMTTCADEFSFATTRTSSPRASSHSAAAASVPTPRSAAIVPGRSSLAPCIAAPRTTTTPMASGSVSEPADTRAANSPSEWPAPPVNAIPSASSTRTAAASQARSAGCTNEVVWSKAMS